MANLTVMKASAIFSQGYITQTWSQKRKGVATVHKNKARVEIQQEQVDALALQYDLREIKKAEAEAREVARMQQKAITEINKGLVAAFK